MPWEHVTILAIWFFSALIAAAGYADKNMNGKAVFAVGWAGMLAVLLVAGDAALAP